MTNRRRSCDDRYPLQCTTFSLPSSSFFWNLPLYTLAHSVIFDATSHFSLANKFHFQYRSIFTLFFCPLPLHHTIDIDVYIYDAISDCSVDINLSIVVEKEIKSLYDGRHGFERPRDRQWSDRLRQFNGWFHHDSSVNWMVILGYDGFSFSYWSPLQRDAVRVVTTRDIVDGSIFFLFPLRIVISFHVSPATRKGKRLQLLQMLLLPFIPVVALVIQNVLTVGWVLLLDFLRP